MEKVNEEIKLAIRQCASFHLYSSWFDWLPEVLIALRMIEARVHGLTQFFVVYKQETLIPARPMAVDMIFPHA